MTETVADRSVTLSRDGRTIAEEDLRVSFCVVPSAAADDERARTVDLAEAFARWPADRIRAGRAMSHRSRRTAVVALERSP